MSLHRPPGFGNYCPPHLPKPIHIFVDYWRGDFSAIWCMGIFVCWVSEESPFCSQRRDAWAWGAAGDTLLEVPTESGEEAKWSSLWGRPCFVYMDTELLKGGVFFPLLTLPPSQSPFLPPYSIGNQSSQQQRHAAMSPSSGNARDDDSGTVVV